MPKLPVLSKLDFQYGGVEYEYESEYDCEGYGDCDEYGICRCRRIVSLDVTEVYLGNVSNQIRKAYKIKNSDVLHRYAIDRLCRIHKLYNIALWETTVDPGYYGEEVGSVSICYQVADRLQADIEKAIDIDNWSSMMEFILESEYGYLLDVVKGRKWNLEKWDPDKIQIGQADHYKRLDKDIVEDYTGYNDLPVCVCTYINEESLRLVDGYHRYAANKDKKSIRVVVGY